MGSHSPWFPSSAWDREKDYDLDCTSQYPIFAVVPISAGVSQVSVEMLGDRYDWPTCQVREGELLEISTR